MRTISDAEREYGKRWREWTQAEWDAVLKTVEEEDMTFPLIINKIMEAFMNFRYEVLTKSVKDFIEKGIAVEMRQMMDLERGTYEDPHGRKVP